MNCVKTGLSVIEFKLKKYLPYQTRYTKTINIRKYNNKVIDVNDKLANNV